MDLLEQYDTFVKFRSRFISDACENAIYTDARDSANGFAPFRPVVLLEDAAALRAITSKIAKWQLDAERLIQADPIRFTATSTQFSVLPAVIYNPKSVAISEGTAQSSRKMSKSSMLFYLRSMLKKELQHNDGNRTALAESIELEIKARENDPETNYRVIGQPHTELYLYYVPNDGVKAKRIRVTQAGVFIYSPDNIPLPIKFPHETTTRKVTFKSDLERLGVKPLKTNLQLSANIFRESDRTNAMAKRNDARTTARRLKPKTDLSSYSQL
ncbi:MAG: hypothetical protein ACRC1W_07015 [Shewanella sp.]